MSEGKDDDEVMAQWVLKEEQTKRQLAEDQRAAELEEELHPTRRPMHRFFLLVRLLTAVCALAMGVGQVLDMVVASSNDLDAVQFVLRVYVVILCFTVVMNEWEWTSFTTGSPILSNWITRGMFYAFVGVLGLAENDVDKNGIQGDAAEIYLLVVAWTMVGLGSLYFLMGITCMQCFKSRMDKDYSSRLDHAKRKQRQESTSRRSLPPGTEA